MSLITWAEQAPVGSSLWLEAGEGTSKQRQYASCAKRSKHWRVWLGTRVFTAVHPDEVTRLVRVTILRREPKGRG